MIYITAGRSLQRVFRASGMMIDVPNVLLIDLMKSCFLDKAISLSGIYGVLKKAKGDGQIR
jgi:hypothetical protein